jgi:GMP synthase-like glutamine amidotransferase
MRSGGMRVLVAQNEEASPPGLIREWLEERDAEVDVVRVDVDDRDVDPRDYDLIVPLGSEYAAYEEERPFVQRSKVLLQRAIDEDVPVLGVCFGGQLLARVLGGDAFRAPSSEIGWVDVRTRDPELVPEGPWFQWHFDSFRPPPEATLIAENDAGPQAYLQGRHLGVQFHPEVTQEIMDNWVRTYRHELDHEGVDPDGLLEETRRVAERSRQASLQLLRRYVDTIAHPGRERAGER